MRDCRLNLTDQRCQIFQPRVLPTVQQWPIIVHRTFGSAIIIGRVLRDGPLGDGILGGYPHPMARDLFPAFATWMRRQGYAENTVIQYQRVVRRWINSHRTPSAWLRRVQEQSRGSGAVALPTTSAKVYEKAIRAWHVFTVTGRPKWPRAGRPNWPPFRSAQ